VSHYKTPQLLIKLLKHLRKSSRGAEIIVVDSQAQKETRLLMQAEFPDIRYLPFTHNLGYAKIVNAGIAAATRLYVLILNADVLLGGQDISRLLRFLKMHGDAAGVGASACFRFPTLGAIFARRTIWAKTPWGKKALQDYEMRDHAKTEPFVVDWVRGDCWMLSRKAIEKVGLLDERFFMYLEDTDWCRRAKNAGFHIYFLPGINVASRQEGASRKKNLRGVTYRFSHLISFLNYLLKWTRQ